MRILDDAMINALIESNPGDFALYLLDGWKLVKLYAAASLPALSGMTPEEYEAVTAEDATAIILDCDRARAADEMGRMLSEGVDADITYRIMHKDFGFVWVHARARVIGEKGGVPVVMVSFTATSLEAEEQTRLLDYTETIIYVTDSATSELLYANGEALKLWGSAEYAGRACYDFINGRNASCPWCPITKLENGECSVPAAYSPLQDMYFDIHCRELNWHGRDAVAVFAHDVTAQQRRQRSLELDVKNLDRILGSIPGGVAVFSDRNGEIHLDYTNDGFYSVHFGSREFWNTKSDNPVNWLCPEDKAVFEDEFKKVKSGLKLQGSATYRVMSEDGKLHWVNNQFRQAYIQDGVQYYYSSFACLDDQKEAEAARAEARRMYESAVEDAKLVVWEYDILNHRVVMAENEFTQYDYRKFGLPKVTENAPQSLVEYIDDRYAETFLDMYRKIDSGAPCASCEVWYKLRPGTEPRCERIMYTTVFDSDGKPVKAYGIGQNITAQKQEEENYSRLYRQISENINSAVASFKLNLSKNLFVSGYSEYPGVLEQLRRPTADEHFAAAAAGIGAAKGAGIHLRSSAAAGTNWSKTIPCAPARGASCG
jgi:PAS domain-containing protein